MTHTEAEQLARDALPCPFCGGRLKVASDHHGFWLEHPDNDGSCFGCMAQVIDLVDMKAWNTRAASVAR